MTLTVRSVFKTYAGPEGKKISALQNCSFSVEEGSFTVIAGRSGCGKTTLLKIIAGLEQADAGAVTFSPSDEPGHAGPFMPKIGFMFQDPRLLPWLTVEQNLALAFGPQKGKREKAARAEQIRRNLVLTGLEDRAASYPRQLSGGMAQRAALARCLCRDPSLLLLDEPLGSLDAFTRTKLRKELERLWQELGLTIILVSHDMEEAVFFGDRVLLMEEGTMTRETAVPLGRPRNYRSAEFQEYCRIIEEGIFDQGEVSRHAAP